MSTKLKKMTQVEIDEELRLERQAESELRHKYLDVSYSNKKRKNLGKQRSLHDNAGIERTVLHIKDLMEYSDDIDDFDSYDIYQKIIGKFKWTK